LLEASNEEVLSVIMKFVYIVSVIVLILAVIWITFGVLNILLSKKHEIVFETKRYLKVLFLVASWLLLWFNIANVLTTIAVCMKNKGDKKEKVQLYTAQE
jgi:NADH:ubiquinone oxidoreductase subunit 6 (subunit J)